MHPSQQNFSLPISKGSLSFAFGPLLVPASSDPTLVARTWQGTSLFSVRLHDVTGLPLTGIEVNLLDASSGSPIAQGVTNASGEAGFNDVPPMAVRVVVRGALPSGQPLRLIGQDIRGIWVQLPPRPWTMELVADVDGVVFPDLATAAALDGTDATAVAEGSFGVLTPTATTPVRSPAPPYPTAGLQPPDIVVSRQLASSDVIPGLPGMVLVAALLTVIVVVIVTRHRL